MDNKYQKISKIGEGAYGCVYLAKDQKTNQRVALKITKFDEDDEGVPSTCIRQASILKSIDHPNLIKLMDLKIYDGSDRRMEMAFQYMAQDLSKFIRKGKAENQSLAKHIIRQILYGVQYLHSKRILHRDLKPHNILISQNYQVKIADFGLGRICCYPFHTMSKQIQTLWYRSPQLLLGTKNYDVGVDSWSIGCIFYELVQSKVMFQSDSQIGQIFQIFKIIGTPHSNQWPQMQSYPYYNISLPKFYPSPPLFKNLSIKGQKFLNRFLVLNPKQRISIKDALNDEYMLQKTEQKFEIQ